MSAKKKEIKKVSKNREELNLKDFMLLDSKKQDEVIRETLDKVYEEQVNINNKQIDKILNVIFDTKDIQAYLPYGLCVDKVGNKIIFEFRNRNNLGLIILFLLAFLFIGGFATYTGVQYLSRALLNQDLDGDGIADLNIDINNDGVCDINCDTNKDGRPDRNIDYHGNRKAVFNVLLDDGKIFNPINQDIDGNGKCDINCDTNSDGWPDLNIDYDGDGKIDLDRDINNDGIKDLDLDINGDGICDVNCDEDKDDKCDKFCANVTIKDNGNGTSSSSGNNGINFEMTSLLIKFDSTDLVKAEDIYPDDHDPNKFNIKIPDLTFSIENTTDNTLYYYINWTEVYNSFETDNFWFKVESTNEGYRQGWSSTPKKDGTLASRVMIPPKSTQKYTISFTLHGTGEEQNIDQGKIFRGKFKVDLIKE